jgi:hypothetical protein
MHFSILSRLSDLLFHFNRIWVKKNKICLLPKVMTTLRLSTVFVLVAEVV